MAVVGAVVYTGAGNNGFNALTKIVISSRATGALIAETDAGHLSEINAMVACDGRLYSASTEVRVMLTKRAVKYRVTASMSLSKVGDFVERAIALHKPYAEVWCVVARTRLRACASRGPRPCRAIETKN